jgi:LacI family transcriptional regulator
VAGYGDITFANISEPPLTTIHVPLGHMGTVAVHLLRQMMEHPAQPPADVLVDVELTARASTIGNRLRVK